MTAPTVEAAISGLMDRDWNVVYNLLAERRLPGADDPKGFFTLPEQRFGCRPGNRTFVIDISTPWSAT